MKKTLLISIIFVLVALPAFAQTVYWDFNTLITDGIVTSVDAEDAEILPNVVAFDDISSLGSGFIFQDLGGDSTVDVSDTFIELGFLQVVSLGYGTDILGGVIENNLSVETDLEMYFYFEGLTGEITSTSADTVNYAMDSGSGTLGLYLDDDLNPWNGTGTTLATFSLLSGSGDLELVDDGEGNLDVSVEFLTVYNDFWYLANGMSFEEWAAIYGMSSITADSFNLGSTFEGFVTDSDLIGSVLAGSGIDIDLNDTAVIRVTQEGSWEITAVPEPSTFLLLGGGLMGLGFYARRRKK